MRKKHCNLTTNINFLRSKTLKDNTCTGSVRNVQNKQQNCYVKYFYFQLNKKHTIQYNTNWMKCSAHKQPNQVVVTFCDWDCSKSSGRFRPAITLHIEQQLLGAIQLKTHNNSTNKMLSKNVVCISILISNLRSYFQLNGGDWVTWTLDNLWLNSVWFNLIVYIWGSLIYWNKFASFVITARHIYTFELRNLQQTSSLWYNQIKCVNKVVKSARWIDGVFFISDFILFYSRK